MSQDSMPPLGGEAKGTTADDPWEIPVPLGARVAPPPFPLEVFPHWLAAMVDGAAEELQVPTDLPGALALAALSTAASGRVQIAARGLWREPVNLYVAVGMPPGSGKSPAFRVMCAPVFAAEKELRAQAKEKIAEAQITRESALAAAERARREAKTPDDLRAAVESTQLADAIEIPVMPRLTADDVVPEQAATIMADQGERLAILSAEGTFFEVIMGRYTNGKPNLELVLKSHVGDRHPVDRRGREEFLESPALTIGVTIQPAMLRELAAKKQMKGRGALQRFLFALPPDLVGHRTIEPPVINEGVLDDYGQTMKRLIVDLADWTDPAVVPLTPAALKRHTDWRSEIEPRLRSGTGDLEGLREWASKLPGATLRLAGLLHLAHDPDTGPRRPIDEHTMDSAIQLAGYYVAHAAAAFGIMQAHEGIEAARAVLEWIGGRKAVKPRDVHRAMQRRFSTAAEVAKTLSLLEDHGYVRRAPDAPNGGRRSPIYEVNPLYEPDSSKGR